MPALPTDGALQSFMPNSSKIRAFVYLLKYRALERDKQQHMALSYGLVLFFFLLFPSLAVATIGTMSLGLCKELWDKDYGSGFCWYDMLANTLGTVAGAATVAALTG